MPEMIEVELYRLTADRTVGHSITRVDAPDPWYLKGVTTAASLSAVVLGETIVGTRRIGKLLLLDTSGSTLGLRFGMTGRLLLAGSGPIERLEYASGRSDPAWVRLTLGIEGVGDLEMVDPRRLGGVAVDPDLSHLGPDAMAVREAQLRALLADGRAPLKAWLLDQSHVAGLGNLLVDEILWRAGLDPIRPGGSLEDREVRRLHSHLRRTVLDLTARGGSHTGDLQPARVRGASCPRDGAPLQRRTIGGRTTFSCPVHQH